MCYCNGFIDLSTLQVQWAKHHCPDSVYAPFQRGPCNSRCLAATSLNCTKSQHRRRLSHVSLSEYMKRERECKFPLNVLLTHPSHRQIHGLFTTSRLHVLRNLSFVGVSTLASLCFPKDCILSNMIVEGIYVFTSYFVFFFNVFNNGTYMVTWSAEMQGTPEMVDFINFGLS